MAVVKVFDSIGVKTLVLSGSASEQDYDPVDDVEDTVVEPTGENEE